MAKTVQPASLSPVQSLTDLPGIGPRKAEWLKAAGIDSLEAVRAAPMERLSHVRGIGGLIAERLKEILSEPSSAAMGTTELTDLQAHWQADLAELRERIVELIRSLQSEPDPRGLSPKFLTELQRLGETIERIPVAAPPDEADHRVKISKHAKAIRKLLESATKLDDTGKNHQKMIRRKLRDRRKRLKNWV